MAAPISYTPSLIGPGTHKEIMDKIDSEKLYRPTTAETLCRLDSAFQNSNEPNSAEILSKFRKNYLWTSTEISSFQEGIFVYDNSDGKMPKNKEDLIGLLNSKDKRVRFVCPEFKTGTMSLSEFLANPLTIAQIGENMLEIAERVAKSCNEKEACILGPSMTGFNRERLTAIVSKWFGGRLGIYSLCHEGNNNGCSFGIK